MEPSSSRDQIMDNLLKQKEALKMTNEKMGALDGMMGVKNDKIKALLAELDTLQNSQIGNFEMQEKIQSLLKMMEEAKKSVQAITPVQIDEIAKYNNPPERIKTALEALFYLLNGKKYDWDHIKSLMKKPDFTQNVLKFNVANCKPGVVQFVKKEYIQQDKWNLEKLKKASKAMGPLGQWLETQIQLSETLEKYPEAKKALEDETINMQKREELDVEQAELDQMKKDQSDLADQAKKLGDKIAQVESGINPVITPVSSKIELKPVIVAKKVNDGVQTMVSNFDKPTPKIFYSTQLNLINMHYYNSDDPRITQLIDQRMDEDDNKSEDQHNHKNSVKNLPFESSVQTDDYYTMKIVDNWEANKFHVPVQTEILSKKVDKETQSEKMEQPIVKVVPLSKKPGKDEATDTGELMPKKTSVGTLFYEGSSTKYIPKTHLDLASNDELEKELRSRKNYIFPVQYVPMDATSPKKVEPEKKIKKNLKVWKNDNLQNMNRLFLKRQIPVVVPKRKVRNDLHQIENPLNFNIPHTNNQPSVINQTQYTFINPKPNPEPLPGRIITYVNEPIQRRTIERYYIPASNQPEHIFVTQRQENRVMAELPIQTYEPKTEFPSQKGLIYTTKTYIQPERERVEYVPQKRITRSASNIPDKSSSQIMDNSGQVTYRLLNEPFQKSHLFHPDKLENIPVVEIRKPRNVASIISENVFPQKYLPDRQTSYIKLNQNDPQVYNYSMNPIVRPDNNQVFQNSYVRAPETRVVYSEIVESRPKNQSTPELNSVIYSHKIDGESVTESMRDQYTNPSQIKTGAHEIHNTHTVEFVNHSITKKFDDSYKGLHGKTYTYNVKYDDKGVEIEANFDKSFEEIIKETDPKYK